MSLSAYSQLIARKMSADMTPPGGVTAGLDALREPGSIVRHAWAAEAWVKASLAKLREAGATGTDEELAAVVLKAVKDREEADKVQAARRRLGLTK